MNNYEKIKNMSLEEMACYFISYELYKLLTLDSKEDETEFKKYKRIKQWLQEES